MIKGVLFDYGGTIDTNGRHWANVLWAVYIQEGIPVTKEQFREAYVYGERALARQPLIQPTHTFADVLVLKCRLQADYLIEKGYLQDVAMGDKIATEVSAAGYLIAKTITANAKKILSVLAKKYPMVLVSNFYGNIESVLADFGLKELFPIIVESAVVGVRKPDPQIFRLGVEALGFLPEECLVVGDSMSKDILPAKSIGCPTIWIKGEGWDDNDSSFDASAEGVTVIKDFQELIKYLG